MMETMKKTIFSLTILLALALTIHIAGAQQKMVKGSSTLIFADGTEVMTLDPQFTTHTPTARIVMHIHETLVKYDMDMNLLPWLAESWAVSGDGLIWTFRLRKGIKFHDGTPFNAEAVKYTFDRLLDPAVASPRKDALSMLKETKILNPYTLAFVTVKPFAPFLNQLTAYNLAILSPTAAKKWGREYGTSPAGTGPFKLESWSPRERIVLSRNDFYWEKKPHLDKLIFETIPNDATRGNLLLEGKVDIISPVPAALVDKMNQSKDIRILRERGFRTIYLGLNNRIKPFHDIRVRKAVAHALDMKKILTQVLKGFGALGGSLEAPAIPGANKDLKPYPYDPAKAKRLLSAAGYPDGFETTFYIPTNRYFMDEEVARAIKAQLKEVGIDVKILTPDWPMLIHLLEKGTEVPMFIMGKGSPSADLNLTLNHAIKTGGKMNYFQYSNPKVDRLISEQEGTVDPKERFRILHQIQSIVYDEVPAITLFYEDQIFGKRANVHGIEIYPFEFINFSRALKN